MREPVKPAPPVTCLWARHSMPACLIGKAGSGVHHGQKRELQHRPNTLPQTNPHTNFSLAIGRRTIHCPEGVPSRPTPSATGRDLRKGTQTCYGDRSPHLEEARSGFWAGERASEGRGCFERGTLNADRRQTGREPPCSTFLLMDGSAQMPAQNGPDHLKLTWRTRG